MFGASRALNRKEWEDRYPQPSRQLVLGDEMKTFFTGNELYQIAKTAMYKEIDPHEAIADYCNGKVAGWAANLPDKTPCERLGHNWYELAPGGTWWKCSVCGVVTGTPDDVA